MKLRHFYIFLFFISSLTLVGQEIDSTQIKEVPTSDEVIDTISESINTDSSKISQSKKKGFVKRFLTESYPSPKKAAILSLILPGAGQAYNKKYWKIPIVYAAFGGLTYAVIYNGGYYRRFKDAYALKLEGQEHEFSNTNLDNATTLYEYRNSFDKDLQLSYIGFFITYVLTASEAFVNAHLLNFNVDDDLTLQINPSLQYEPIQGTQVGIGLSLRPQAKPKQVPKSFLLLD